MAVVRVQIAGISTLEDALAADRFGADAVGFTLRLPDGPHDGLTEAGAREIIERLPPFITPVLITYVDNAREAIDLCRYLRVTALQLHGPIEPGQIRRIKEELPYLKVIKGINVVGESSLVEARRFEAAVDALILDTYDRESGRRGATGRPHDWRISARVVREVRVPVMLAGGLTPENVGAAIAEVRPWGVDVHTGIETPEGAKDLNRMRIFIAAAKAVDLDNND
ncbi:MAG TPA: phosphoribosylanthranilate isomerase [Dehalococcoidia bacterium]